MSNKIIAEIVSSKASLEHLLECKGTERRLLNLPVNLIHSDKSQQSCIAINVSLSGMLLQSGAMTANVGEIVELDFKLNFDGWLKQCRILAEIVGVGEQEVAIGFHKFNDEIFRYIYKMMYDSDHNDEFPVLDWAESSN